MLEMKLEAEALVEKLLEQAKQETVRIVLRKDSVYEAALRQAGLLGEEQESKLSMQHMEAFKQELTASKVKALVLEPVAENTSPEERALIYAMLLRSRKVISFRDKLEDLLRSGIEEQWPMLKEKYEQKVIGLYKQSWKSQSSYPYVIVDNIKAYNRDENYIMKELYHYVGQRQRGVVNAGDEQMINTLRQMFEEISLAILDRSWQRLD